jgi:choline dehydrogenase
MQDHFNSPVAFRCTKRITLNHVANGFVRRGLAGAQYVLFRSGPLATNPTCAGAFARSDATLDQPDLQLNSINYTVASRDRGKVRAHPFPGITVDVVHLQPQARGSVRMKSPDPLAPPEIRCNFLRTQQDAQALTAGMRLARKIAQQPALADYLAEGSCPDPISEAMPNSRPASARTVHPSCTPWAPAEWEGTRLQYSIRGCGCAG